MTKRKEVTIPNICKECRQKTRGVNKLEPLTKTCRICNISKPIEEMVSKKRNESGSFLASDLVRGLGASGKYGKKRRTGRILVGKSPPSLLN